MRVLGVDPGSNVTGVGVVNRDGDRLTCILYEEIKAVRGTDLPARLIAIYNKLTAIIGETRPDAIAIEDIFYGKNAASLIKQGHVRGVTILAGALQGKTIYEYSPLEVKQAVVGYGRAEKAQVQKMVKEILALDDLPPADAADALAVAICHAHRPSLVFL